MPTNKQKLIKKIEDLERQLQDLKLEPHEEENIFEVGNKVQILKLKKGQATRGTIHKLHWNTQRATFITQINDSETRTIVRMLKNLKKE